MQKVLILWAVLLFCEVAGKQTETAASEPNPSQQDPEPSPPPEPDVPQPTSPDQCSINNCSASDYHICNAGANVCVKPISEAPITYVISADTSYFYFQPQFEAYSLLLVTFCGQPVPGASNMLHAKIQENPSELPNDVNSILKLFPAMSTCVQLRAEGVYFGKETEGSFKKLVLSLQLTASGVENMTISVVGRASANRSVLSIMFTASVVVLCIVLLLTILNYIRRRCYVRKQPQNRNNTNHLDKYMPVKKLRECSQTETANCSVCLNDITREEEVRCTPCNHYFHPPCLNDWCKKVLNCPNCRLDFSRESLKNYQKATAEHQLTPRRWWSRERDMRTHLVEETTVP